MFTPQLSEVQRKPLHECLSLPVWICNSILRKGEYDWGYGGAVIAGEVIGRQYPNQQRDTTDAHQRDGIRKVHRSSGGFREEPELNVDYAPR